MYRPRGRDTLPTSSNGPPPSAASSTTSLTPCPDASCSVRFGCDACLDEHLRSVHETDYRAVFGDVPEAWTELCPGHQGLPLDRLTNPSGPG